MYQILFQAFCISYWIIILDSYPKNPPVLDDEKAKLTDPFSLNKWIDKHKEEFSHGSSISLFPDQFQTRAYVISKGHHMIDCSTGDVWLWQHVSNYIIVSKKESIFLFFWLNRKDIQQLT